MLSLSSIQPLILCRRLVAFLSGVAHLSLPVPVHGNNSALDEAYVTGADGGLSVVIDTEGTGHITEYPTDEPTATLSITFESVEDLPEHTVVGSGSCQIQMGSAQVVS